MVDALTHSNLGSGLVRQGTEGEGKSRESLVNFDEKGSRTFHLKVVDLLKLAFENGATSVVLTGDTLA